MRNKLFTSLLLLAVGSVHRMADDASGNGTATAEEKKGPVFTVKNNNIELNVIEYKIAKGQTAGSIYYGLDLENISTEQLLSFFPADKFRENFIDPNLRRNFLALTKEAKAAAGEDQKAFEAEFSRLLIELSARAESIKALTERRNELLAELSKLSPTTNLDAFVACATKVANVEKAIAEKRSKDDDDKAEDKKEGNAANAPVANVG